MKRRNRSHPAWHLLGGLLVGGWLISVAALVHQHGLAHTGRLLTAQLLVGAPGEEEGWFGIFLSGRRVGWTHARLAPTADGLQLEEESRLKFSPAGVAQELDIRLEAALDERGALRSVSLRVEGLGLSSSMFGLWEAGKFRLVGNLNGESVQETLTITQRPLLDRLIPRLLAAESLEPGQVFLVEVFDPQNLSNRRQQIEVLGPEAVKTPTGLKPVFRVRRTWGELTVDTWFDEAGWVWREESSLGLVLQREEKDQAMAIDDGASASSSSWQELVNSLVGGRKVQAP